jgi:hypothetical protein
MRAIGLHRRGFKRFAHWIFASHRQTNARHTHAAAYFITDLASPKPGNMNIVRGTPGG